MEKKHLVIKSKIFGCILVFAFFWSCAKKEESELNNSDDFKEEVIFKDNSFKKGLDTFIKETNIYGVKPIESIIVMMYINQDSDTIVSFTNFRPYESVNLVAVNRYKDYKLYFYTPKNLYTTMDKFVNLNKGKIQNVLLQVVDESSIDPMGSYTYYIKNNEIVIPLENTSQ